MLDLVGTRPVDGGQPVTALVRPVEEGRVVHAERREDALLDEFVERLSGRDLDHARQGVDPREAAVAPLRPRLEVERDLRHAGDVGLQRVLARPGRVDSFGACRVPIPPLPRPEVCVNRSRIVTCRSAGTSSTLPSFSTATFRSLNSGMNFETGSVRRTLPSSISIITATPVTGLVEEAMRKRASVVIGLLRLGVRQAVGREVDDLPLAGDERHGPGDVMLVDVTLDDLVDATQPFGRDTHVLRLRPGRLLLRPRRSCRDQGQDGEDRPREKPGRGTTAGGYRTETFA